MARAEVAFLTWSSVGGRSREIAASLGGEARSVHSLPDIPKWLVPLRWLVSAVRTVMYLARARPRRVVVTNPPVFAPLIVYLYARLTRASWVMDSHPGSFGLKGDVVARTLLPVHRFLARRSDSTLVTCRELVDRIEQWGGRAQIVHEAPPAWAVREGRPLGQNPRVLVVGTLDPDEPVQETLAAAALLPDVSFELTGAQRRLPVPVTQLPANVQPLGFLAERDYIARLEAADVVLCLTTEPLSVMRGACEAVYAERPLVTSDWPALRDFFPGAVHVENTAESIATGVRAAVERHAELRLEAPEQRRAQQLRWERQLEGLAGVLGIELAERQTPLPIRFRARHHLTLGGHR
jgi:hypothetical protein